MSQGATLELNQDPSAPPKAPGAWLKHGIGFLTFLASDREPPSDRLHGWLAYTLSQNLRALGGGVIAPSDWDQRHILNLVVGYRLGKYTVGGRAHLHTGRPVPITQEGAQSFRRLPTYYQIDLRADRRFVFDAYTLEFYVELVNATLNRQVLSFSHDFTSGAVTENGFRIVLPSIGVHGEF